MAAPLLTTRERAQLDLLVPPPWPVGRRAGVSLLALLIVALGLVLARSGLVGPELGGESARSGGGTYDEQTGVATAFQQVQLVNQGWLPVTLLAFEPPPLPGVDWTGTDPALPVAIEAGGTLALNVRLRVERCRAVDARGLMHVPFRARSGVAPSRVVRLRAGSATEPTWRGALPQRPSWVTETLDAVCTIPDG